MKRKLLFVTQALWIGGIETALVNLLNRLDYEKYDVSCLVLQSQLDMADRITPKCRLLVADRERVISFPKAYPFCRLHHLTRQCTNPSRLHNALMWAVPAARWLENRLYIRYIRKNLKKERFDTCIIYSDRTAETAVRAVRAKQYLLFYHNAVLEKAYHDEIGYRRSRKIVAVSEKKAEELKAFRPRHAGKYMAIHNLVDLAGVRARSRRPSGVTFPETGFHLVTCGRLARQKGIDWAIQAMKLLLDRGYEDLQWWVLGGGPEAENLERQIGEAGIGAHFHLLGMQSNPYPYMAAADLYVQPSRYENYSVAVLEAMALYRPILATVPAAGAQIRSGETGLLCGPGPEAIADGVAYLYNHREDMARYTQALQSSSLEEENRKIMDSLQRLFDGE